MRGRCGVRSHQISQDYRQLYSQPETTPAIEVRIRGMARTVWEPQQQRPAADLGVVLGGQRRLLEKASRARLVIFLSFCLIGPLTFVCLFIFLSGRHP